MAFKIDFAFDVQQKLNDIAEKLDFNYLDVSKIVCMRSHGSKARAYARIWSLERTWQIALNVPPHYVIEVLAEKFDMLPEEEKEKTLIHELLHIPKKFSGSLVPHICFGKHITSSKNIEKLHDNYKAKIL